MPAKELFHVGDDALQSGTAFVSWDPTGTLLACCGKSRKVLLYSRSSKLVGEVPLPLKGNVLSMEWDYEGAVLAILQAESSVLTLYEVHTKRVEQLDVKLKDVSYITWSSSTPHLAIGTAKGNLLIYNRKTMRKYPVIGKHSKKIVCGSWSASEGTRLALGSDDRELTISSSEGDLLFQSTVSAEPREMLFGPSGQQMSVNLGKSLLLFDIVQKGQPFELLFQAKYGTIVAHTWFGDGYIALGFSEGYFAVVSTHRKEMASEVFGCKVSDSIAGLRFSHSLQRAALLCEDGVRFVDVSDSTSYGVMESEFISIPRIKYGLLQTSSWSSDGQLLAVGTADGHMLLYLTSIPLVVASNPVNETIAFRSSLREVTVSDSSRKKRVLPFDMEVSMLAVDEQWIAVVANHVVVLANHTVEGGKAVSKTEHMASVTTLQLTSGFLGTLTSDRVLHVSQTGQKATSSSTSARYVIDFCLILVYACPVASIVSLTLFCVT
jgi:WD repeat-containing protein 19